ncbi:DNA polymerase Y family protein [Polaromonas sp.]|uniref:DNA polymerase Y family protein n=1 Tax=Polaromonas sp. TaxID=1869339 RepID=UPI00179C04D3|nr:DNA polymerase Y family protein [Polaromonas sp.]NMM04787.1 DNA polymerase Y family protein [Polaromonas sp.]
MRWIALQACIRTEPGPAVLNQAAAQRALASIALGFTPRVALLDEAVLLEVSGSLRLFGGLARLAQLLVQQASQFFQENKVLAHIERAQGATSLIALGRLRQAHVARNLQLERQHAAARQRVAELPMHTLSAARAHLGVLERIGCRNWDDLLRLPRDGVARRFGAPLLAALDRARGHAPDGYDWLVLPESFDEKLELDALVIHAPALMSGVERLLLHLQAWLLGRQSGLRALKLVWQLDQRRDVPPTGELVVRTAQPAQDLRHVARLIAEQLGQQRLPAPVHTLRLQSLETEKLTDSAAATASLLMQERKQGDSALELIERLSARLGAEQVQVWQPCADHRPEQMQRWISAVNAVSASSVRSAIKSIASNARTVWARGLNDREKEQKTEALYPSWLLYPPLRLAMHGDSPVYQGRLQRLAGPQRLEVSGWLMAGDKAGDKAGEGAASGGRSRPPAIRDYFIYRSGQGGLLWIYSERLPVAAPQSAAGQPHAWYLHGFFA